MQGAIAAGGVAGALARALPEHLWPASGHGWPWTTFAVNTVGTLLLGYFATRLQERLPPSTYRRPLLGTGLCGALTTFSTLQVEALTLWRHGHVGLGVAYIAGTLAAGLLGIHLATGATRRVRLR
ncbi:MAG TPA: fluoride efflux transporter CrcB [Gaiellaceae bacterium]|jgi:CrcB protein|nr:fluoride efflux transporter CrcB [Gaiellaceae bacterium]